MTGCPIAAAERSKYQRMWAHAAYRRNAPGESSVVAALQVMDAPPGARVVDLGCGTGRPALRLVAAGYRVTAVDITESALDEAAQIAAADGVLEFRELCLWDDLPAGGWGFGVCTDVLEHLPPERVDATIGRIAAAVTGAVYFRIATRPDNMGQLIGERLHLSVADADTWRGALCLHFESVEAVRIGGDAEFICRGRR